MQQTGGITVEYNLDLDYGKRVITVKVGNEPLDENKLYTVATNNFVAVNENYPQLENTEETGEYSACDGRLLSIFHRARTLFYRVSLRRE